MEESRFLPRPKLQTLIDALDSLGCRTIGPVVQDGAIEYRDLNDAEQLPHGWTDAQSRAATD